MLSGGGADPGGGGSGKSSVMGTSIFKHNMCVIKIHENNEEEPRNMC